METKPATRCGRLAAGALLLGLCLGTPGAIAQDRSDREVIVGATTAMGTCAHVARTTRVTVRVRVAPDGRVESAATTGSIGAGEIQCIEQVARDLRFAARPSAQSLSFPLTFAATP